MKKFDSTTFNKAFGLNMRRLRKLKGYTLRSLAKKMDIAFSYLTKVETGNGNPTIKRVSEIAEALEVPIIKMFQFPH